LESEFVFQNTVEELAVLAGIAVVNLGVVSMA
jgi:hypothetical protein